MNNVINHKLFPIFLSRDSQDLKVTQINPEASRLMESAAMVQHKTRPHKRLGLFIGLWALCVAS